MPCPPHIASEHAAQSLDGSPTALQGKAAGFRRASTIDSYLSSGLVAGEQAAEFWPRLPVQQHLPRYAFDEKVTGEPTRSYTNKHTGVTCSKYPSSSGLSHGLMTAACCNCFRITGMSLMSKAEGPKSVGEVVVTRLGRDESASADT